MTSQLSSGVGAHRRSGSLSRAAWLLRADAFQAQRCPSSPHSEAALAGDELDSLLGRAAAMGDLMFWFDETALASWQAPRRSTPGCQPQYSDLAIDWC